MGLGWGWVGRVGQGGRGWGLHRKKCDIPGRAGGYLDPAAGVQASQLYLPGPQFLICKMARFV